MQASDGWLDSAMAYFDDPLVAAVAPAIFDAADPNQLIATGVAYRPDSGRIVCRSAADNSAPAQAPTGPLLQAAFYRKSVIDTLGGISAEVGDDLADIDLALTLRRAGWKVCGASECRVLATSLNFDERSDSFAASLQAERYYWRHAGDNGWFHRVLAHPLAAAIDVLFAKPWWTAARPSARTISSQFAN